MVLQITQGISPTDIMNLLIPPTAGISYRNVNFGGATNCASLFSDASSVITNATLGFPDSGFVLGTGLGVDLVNQDGTENYYDFGTPGDSEITDAYGEILPSFDACTISFEFTCDTVATGNVNVDYVFSSDEYKEQIIEGAGYADLFALLLNGVNIATVPGSGEGVGVYTVNHENNSEYFVFNDPRPGQSTFPGFEPDGFTTGLTAQGNIIPGWNTMKIGITDVSDPFFDSWLFIKSGSFTCVPQDTGSGSGDPHFRTFDDHFFSYHGQCDLVLSRSNGFASGLGLDVHVRTTRVNSPHMEYSYISAAAVRIGNDVLEITEEGDALVNGEETNLEYDTPTLFAGYPLAKSVKGKNQRIIVHDLDLGDNKKIQIRTNTKSGMLFVDVNGAYPDSEGLLGASNKDGKPLLARDGITDLTGHWNTYGEEWQVNDNDPKLFQDSSRHPQYPKGCVYEAEMEKSHIRRRRLMEGEVVSLDAAQKACAHLKEEHMQEFCVNDIMATGDLDIVEDPFYSN